MEIHVDAEDKYGYRIDMENELKAYLSMCQLSCKIIINGEIYKDWLYQRNFTRSLTFGNIYTNKSSENTGFLFVRVNGMWSLILKHHVRFWFLQGIPYLMNINVNLIHF